LAFWQSPLAFACALVPERKHFGIHFGKDSNDSNDRQKRGGRNQQQGGKKARRWPDYSVPNERSKARSECSDRALLRGLH